VEKLTEKKYFSGLYFFIISTIFIIFLNEYINYCVDFVSKNNQIEILKFILYSILILLLYLALEFFRIKTQIPIVNIRSFFVFIVLAGIINFSVVPKNFNLLIEIFIIDIGCIYIIFQICKNFENNPFKWLGLVAFKSKDYKYFYYYFSAWPLIILWGIIVEYSNIDALKNSNYSEEIVNALNYNYFSVFILACIVAPISEEIIFRGFILKIIRKKYNIQIAIVVNSILFGLIHIEPSAVVPATILGFALSFIRIKAKSVFASIIIHSMHNLFALVITFQAL
jgi:membrane protease YdiL (CAAX protease family)